ncbi:MAG: glycosyltransferase [Chloroflexi bacterium]|nr:glycosyltransferase [Chloroflexota bacterium]MCI0834146.1 glycosyltransferase [Chloroflexota bacterium]MCI0836681.1 glycosyltransferase [Chloroflexota bacterium]MCI0851280.1 glycosyltransferase [Chloroflexota bacterium]
MKVILVSSKYSPEYSGSGLRAHRTYLRLREKYKVEVEVICSGTEYLSPETYFQDDLQVTRVVSPFVRKLHSIFGKGPVRRLTNAAVFQSEMKRVTRLLETKSADVLHAFGYSPATMAAIRWSRVHKIPLMRELVNVVPSPYQYPPGRFGDHLFEFPDLSVVVAISAELGKMSNRAGLTENVWVRPNPVDVERFHFASNSERDESRSRLTPFSPDDRVIVFVSKFRRSKNQPFLLDVLARLPENYKLLLAGPPSDANDSVPGLSTEQIYGLQVRAESMGMRSRVITKPGFVDAADYLRIGNVFCMPAEKEAMGTPLLEALATGLPVVANRGEPSFREWIVDGQNGFLRKLDASEWANAVLATEHFSSTDRKSMSDQVRAVVSTDRIDEQYHKLLSALSEAGPGESVSVADVIG